jgi:hypothetical protein
LRGDWGEILRFTRLPERTKTYLLKEFASENTDSTLEELN